MQKRKPEAFKMGIHAKPQQENAAAILRTSLLQMMETYITVQDVLWTRERHWAIEKQKPDAGGSCL
jgi:hypothetical protein